MPRINRRNFLKTTSVAVPLSAIAGCADQAGNGNGNGNGGSTTQPPTTDTPTPEDEIPDPADVGEEEYAEEWRKVATENAAEELDGEEINLFATDLSDNLRDALADLPNGMPDPDIYEPLAGKLNTVTGDTEAYQQRYIREVNAGGTQTMEVLMFTLIPISGSTEFMDLSVVPGFRTAPENAKAGNFRGSVFYTGAGIQYNTDRVEEPPENYDDLLKPEFADNEILLDFNPNPLIAGGFMATKGEAYYEDLADQNPTQISSGYGITLRVGQGEAKANFQSHIHLGYNAQVEQGLPIEIVKVPEVNYWKGKVLGAATNPKHPWAARLLIDLFMRQDNHDLQTASEGQVSLDGTQSNPGDIKDFFDEDRVWHLDRVRNELDWVENEGDITQRVQELLDSPVA